MHETAEEKIVLEADVLLEQEDGLARAVRNVERGAGPSNTSMSDVAFGAMCSFLPPAMNYMASHISETAEAVAQMAERMHDGVKAGRESFTQFEQEASQNFKNAGEVLWG